MKCNKCKNKCKTGTKYTKGEHVKIVKCKKVKGIKQGTHVKKTKIKGNVKQQKVKGINVKQVEKESQKKEK